MYDRFTNHAEDHICSSNTIDLFCERKQRKLSLAKNAEMSAQCNADNVKDPNIMHALSSKDINHTKTR